MGVSGKHFECIAVSILAVNGWKLSKIQGLLPGLARESLLDAAIVSSMSLEHVIAALVRAHYDRGNLTWRFAERLKIVATAACEGRLDGLADALAAGDRNRGTALMDAIQGVGPHVANTAWSLLTDA